MKLVKQSLYEKFTEEGDPITDMGIGGMKGALYSIVKEDRKHDYIKAHGIYQGRFYGQVNEEGNIDEFVVTGAVGRNQQYRTGTYFKVIFKTRHLFSKDKFYSSGTPKRIDKIKYIKELVDNSGITDFFEKDVTYNYHEPQIVNFRIKPEYKKYFKSGHYNADELIKRNINEKFKKDSDPIKDMGTGSYEVDFYGKLRDINKKAKLEKQKFFRELYGKTIEGNFKDEMLHVYKFKFKLKKIVESKYIGNVYYLIDENGGGHKLDDEKIKVWG